MSANNKKRIIFMGTPDFSIPSLEKIFYDEDLDLIMVITKEDKEAGRGKELKESSIKTHIKNLCNTKNIKLSEDINIIDDKYVEKDGKNIFLSTPKKIRDDKNLIEKIRFLKPDFIIVVAYGQILPKEILDIPKYACINGHASLLPKYRGASPIQASILNGDKITGTTTMLMSEGMDEGDILLNKKIEISDNDTGESLFDKLSIITADALIETIKNFDNIKPIKQDESKATYVKMIKKEDGLIDLENYDYDIIDRKVRGYYPWPSAYVKDEDGKIIKIYKVKRSDIFDNIDDNGKVLIKYGKDKLLLKCKSGYVEVLELQVEGKKRMNAKDFINGMR